MSARRITVRHACDSAAPPAAVFALLADSSTYPEWSQVHVYRMERPGFDAPHGVGEIRVLSSRWGLDVREEIVEIIPDRLMAYTLLSGLPMRIIAHDAAARCYTGAFDLMPPGGSIIQYTYGFRAPVDPDEMPELDATFVGRELRSVPPMGIWSYRLSRGLANGHARSGEWIGTRESTDVQPVRQ